MSIADWDPSVAENGQSPAEAGSKETVEKAGEIRGDGAKTKAEPPRRMHRLAEVRRQQGLSQRNMARRLGVDLSVVCQVENEGGDLPLSVLYTWQKVLDVPIAELLVDSDAPLSPPVLERARMVKLMKTTVAIMDKAQTNAIRRMVTMLIEQLLEIMPELRDVSAWHTVGQRRTLEDYGRVVERQVSDEMLRRQPR